MCLAYNRAPVNIQTLHLRTVSSKNRLDLQIPAVLWLSAIRDSASICLDPDVALNTFPRQQTLYKSDRWHGV